MSALTREQVQQVTAMIQTEMAGTDAELKTKIEKLDSDLKAVSRATLDALASNVKDLEAKIKKLTPVAVPPGAKKIKKLTPVAVPPGAKKDKKEAKHV